MLPGLLFLLLTGAFLLLLGAALIFLLLAFGLFFLRFLRFAGTALPFIIAPGFFAGVGKLFLLLAGCPGFLFRLPAQFLHALPTLLQNFLPVPEISLAVGFPFGSCRCFRTLPAGRLFGINDTRRDIRCLGGGRHTGGRNRPAGATRTLGLLRLRCRFRKRRDPNFRLLLLLPRNGRWHGQDRDRNGSVRSSRTVRTIRADIRPIGDFRSGRLLLPGAIPALGSAVFLFGAAVPLAFLNLLAAPLKTLPALAIKSFPPARIGNDALRLAGFLPPAFAETLAHILRQLTRALHLYIAEIAPHPRWAQSLVPIRIHARCDHAQFAAIKARAMVPPAPAEFGTLVHPQAVHGKCPPDFPADPIVAGAADKHAAVVHPVMGDVPRATVDDRVPGQRKAVPGNGASEMVVGHEGEPRAADPEGDLHGGIPRAVAIGECFRGKRRPTDIAGAFTPRHPCRRPLVARNPYPACIAQKRPTPVVVAGPAEGFIGNPGPAVVSERPPAAGVRSPGSIAHHRGLIDITVVRRVEP